MSGVRKGVIPVAGMGTRFLPATKAIPKEMLPIVDRPIIHYVVEEALASGFEDVIFVTSHRKKAVEEHFNHDYELEGFLKARGKDDLLKMIGEISTRISISSVRQKQPLGLGHAVLQTESFVGHEPVGVFLADDIIRHDIPAMKQLTGIYEEREASVIAVQEVPWESVSRYGITVVEPVEEDGEGRLFRIKDIVEKPTRDAAPSNLAIIGRYILTPRIFESLKETDCDGTGEIQLTDGVRRLMDHEVVYAYRLQGLRYDVGNKLEYLIATVDYALQREDVGEGFRAYLKKLEL